MTDSPEALARSAFASAFGADPAAIGRAPGRVELLGNHTDSNGGLVLAAAIDRETVVVGRAVAGACARVRSANLDRTDAFTLPAPPRGEDGSWGRYVRGVAWVLGDRAGRLVSGFDAAVAGNVPLGAGLSSSASLQAATAMFLLHAGVVGLALPAPARSDEDTLMGLAALLRKSENEFVGVASGLLDQFSSLFGREGHALMLDCRTLAHESLPLGDPAPAIVVCDSTTSRRLADGMYNRRREECERVVSSFRDLRGPGSVSQLRDVSLEDLEHHWEALDSVGRRRARHVLTENDRVRLGAEALKTGDVAGFGRLISASHASSRDDFENSSPALDALIEAAEQAPGFLGGKLSGAGWAGCTVNLVLADRAPAFAEAVREGYARRMGMEPLVHVCRAAAGASGGPLAPGTSPQ